MASAALTGAVVATPPARGPTAAAAAVRPRLLACSTSPRAAPLLCARPAPAGRASSAARRSRAVVRSAADVGVEQETEGRVAEVLSGEDMSAALEGAGDALVVLDISSSRCGPCKMIYPYYVELSEEFTDAVFLKVQGDANKDTLALMKEWKVKAVPEFRFFRNGELVHKMNGAQRDKLRAAIEEQLAA